MKNRKRKEGILFIYVLFVLKIKVFFTTNKNFGINLRSCRRIYVQDRKR